METMDLTVLFLLAPLVFSEDPEICTFRGIKYECASAKPSELLNLKIPEDNCHAMPCRNCLKVWKTLIVNQNEAIKPQFFFSRQRPSEKGPRTLITCKRQGFPCICSPTKPCTGTAQYCQRATCANSSSNECYCQLTPAEVSLVHRDNGREIINPTLLSYQVCAARYLHPTVVRRDRHQRYLLSDEEAVFLHDDMKIVYSDPVRTVSHPGVLVIRIEGQERVVSLNEPHYQTIVPPEMLTSTAEMKIIFVTTTGSTLRG